MLFSISEGAASLDQQLTPLQRAQLDAALNLQALLNPGRVIRVQILIGEISQMPVFSGESTESGALSGRPLASVLVRSTARSWEAAAERSAAERDPAAQSSAEAQRLPRAEVAQAEVARQIRLAHRDATPATTRRPQPQSVARRVYDELERRAPLLLDEVREVTMSRRERAISGPLPRYPHAERDDEVVEAYAGLGAVAPGAVAPGVLDAPLDAATDAPPAVLFGLHWLQTGGAERWAVESIGIAKQRGLAPVVVVDQNSVHPWLLRPELEGCTVIALGTETREPEAEPALAAALLANFDLRGIMIHHCYWLYRALPWIKRQRPELPVVDSLHIVEYLGGGYPGLAVRFDEFIDQHHAISPELVNWLESVQRVRPGKNVMAPLATLTVAENSEPGRGDADGAGDGAADSEQWGFAARDRTAPFTLAFIGRLSRQKRPDLFIGLVHRLRRKGFEFRAIMHGDGEMREVVDGLIDRYRLRGVIEQRFEDAPVAQTLADADLLVLTSINEGLTLTTFEALASGVPVLSTDVGSQRTIVQGGMLLPRPARPFLKRAERAIRALAADERVRERVWAEQHSRVTEFSNIPDARHYTEELFEQWKQ